MFYKDNTAGNNLSLDFWSDSNGVRVFGLGWIIYANLLKVLQ